MSKLSKPPRQSVSESRPFEGLSRIHYHAAGVDIGAHEIVVCVPGPNDTQIVRTFANYTADLYQLADGLSEYGIQMVATPQGCRKLWSPRGCIGSRCSRRSKRVSSGVPSSAPLPSSVSPAANRTCSTVNGSKPYTVMACWPIRSVRRLT